MLLLSCYVLLLIRGMAQLGFWDMSQLKGTIIWFITVGLGTLFNVSKIRKQQGYFRNAVIDNIKLSVFIEYLLGLYVFPLVIELVLVPVATFLGVLLVMAKSDEKYKQVAGCLNVVMTILGLGLIGHVVYNAYIDFANLATAKTAVDFSSTIILSVLLLPFIYAAYMYASYKEFYVRLQWCIKDSELRRYTKWQAALFCKLDLHMLDRFWKNLVHNRPVTRREVVKLLEQSRSKQIAMADAYDETQQHPL